MVSEEDGMCRKSRDGVKGRDKGRGKDERNNG